MVVVITKLYRVIKYHSIVDFVLVINFFSLCQLAKIIVMRLLQFATSSIFLNYHN